MKSLALFSIFISIASQSFAIKEWLDIGLYWDDRPSSTIFSPANGDYEIFGDGEKVGEIQAGSSLQVFVKGNKVQVKSTESNLGDYSNVKFRRKIWGTYFHIKSIIPNKIRRSYDDNLTVSVLSGKLKLVNNVYLEHYIAGVIEAESGSKQVYEFYKVQAIICRTYALSNLNKFRDQGFNLCDRVNSQVYKGKSMTNPEIINAVKATKGIVIVDSDINLISAVFHSNSGGMTANSEDVWTNSTSYLRAKPDSFSTDQSHSNWSFYVPTNNWLTYLANKHKYPITDSLFLEYVLEYCPDERERFLTPLDTTILLKDIRKDWNFKSAYFTFHEKDGYVHFYGRGFGHGVGLSQQGAMRMAELGYNYREILHYYYQNIHLINLSALDFFRAD